MSELFPQPVNQESYDTYDTTQDHYVHALAQHTATIPNLSELPAYYSFSPEESTLLGTYSSASQSNIQAVIEQGIDPLFREDIIDPSFCKGVGELTRQITGNPLEAHWYKRVGDNLYSTYRTDSNQARSSSRRWEVAFVGYMRERRIFHAAFMQALLTKEPIDGLVSIIKQPHEVPSSDIYKGGMQSAPDLMYNPTNWLTSSLLSILALPPELCSADMKQHAIEQWAQHADSNDSEAMKGFHKLNQLSGPMRLPWSMRSNADLYTNYHPQWYQNRIVKEYLGDILHPKADGLDALLQQRPKDYIQILILQTFNDIEFSTHGLRNLAHATTLTPEIKNIIFAGDAAHNTIYSGRSALPAYDQPTTLLEYLERSTEGVSEQTQETIIEGQRLRIRLLEDRIGALEEEVRRKNNLTEALERKVRLLTNELRGRQTTNTPVQTRAGTLMAKYGIDPNVSNDLLEDLISGLRRGQNRKLHADKGVSDEERRRIMEINGELDTILRYRGLGKNRQG